MTFIVKVELATIEDCLQVSAFDSLTNYFIELLQFMKRNDCRIVLQRTPENNEPVIYKVLFTIQDLKEWINQLMTYLS